MMFNPVRKYIITYTNSKQETLSTTVSSADAVSDWTDRLDDRIAKGTCTGYLVTQFDTWEMVKSEAGGSR